jgi:uncharacterized membrane protein
VYSCLYITRQILRTYEAIVSLLLIIGVLLLCLQDVLYQPIIAIIMMKKLIIPILCMIILAGWLYESPPGLLGKADAIGYAVCHRIDSRSFHLDDRALPLCARCSGLFLGAVIGLVYQQIRFPRRGGMLTIKTGIPFLLFFFSWAFDGANSYLHLIPGAPGLYEPNNVFRLFTGLGMGLAISAILFPAFNQSVWARYDPRPIFIDWKPYLEIMLLGFGIGVLFLSNIPFIIYPLAIISALGVLIILVPVYSLIWMMVFKYENLANSWRDLWVYLSAGLLTAMIQIVAIDLVRFWFTRTWDGFKF